MTPGQRDNYARKLVDAMNGNREISNRLCQFPESRISAYALRVAVSNALSKPKVLASFLPLLNKLASVKENEFPETKMGSRSLKTRFLPISISNDDRNFGVKTSAI